MDNKSLTVLGRVTVVLLSLALLSCGGGGGGGSLPSDQFANSCAWPRSGVDPDTGKAYPDRRGSIDDEKRWVHAYMNDIYLWYREIPSVNAAPYTDTNYGGVSAALDAYFQALKTPAVTASGKRKDQFSFTYPTEAWRQLSESGMSVGYGMQVALLAQAPPREAVIVYTDPGTPATDNSIARGAQILQIDGVDLINDGSAAGTDTLNAGLFPENAGESHQFRILDQGASVARDVTLTAQPITETPVQNVKTFDTATGRVGYVLFNDHIATAEGELYRAVQQLAAAGINDLVLDLRYNGGGYLDIASELAYMIAGATATQNKVFEQSTFNDKNPLAGSPSSRTGFHSTAQGLDPLLVDGTPLPQLGLRRLFVLVGKGTCSASEAIVNGLRGIDVPVVLIGNTTCGKPYGFYPQDNCGLTYFAIEFSGTNNQGFGDYADGFTPNCQVADDFSHALGDSQEALLAAALAYRDSGTCPIAARRAAAAAPVLLRSPLREMRLARPAR